VRCMGLLMFFLLGVCTACQVESGTLEPSSAAAATLTPTEASISASEAVSEGPDEGLATMGEPDSTETSKPAALDGPWMVYPAPDGSGLHAYDVDAGVVIEIPLPELVYPGDLVDGLSPDGHTLILRAGSPLNTDELALYQIDLPSTQAIKVTPLLSLSIQRDIINGEDAQALTVLSAVTFPDGLAWSPDGRYLAFSAALDSHSSDLYVLDIEKDRINRLNGLYTQSVSPSWAPGSNWLVNQELGSYASETGWRSEVVDVISVPDYADQNALYIPGGQSQSEVFVAWINAQSLISCSQTADGLQTLRQVNVINRSVGIHLQGGFRQVAFDPESRCLALVLSEEDALPMGLMGGVYLLQADSTALMLQRAGDWGTLKWDEGGVFVVVGSQGVFAFTPEGKGLILRDEGNLNVSPSGNWMIAWGNGEAAAAGARLYQNPSGNLLQQITDQAVISVHWLPDSKAFLIQSEGTLYYLAFPDLNLTKVEAGVSADTSLEFIWVE